MSEIEKAGTGIGVNDHCYTMDEIRAINAGEIPAPTKKWAEQIKRKAANKEYQENYKTRRYGLTGDPMDQAKANKLWDNEFSERDSCPYNSDGRSW